MRDLFTMFHKVKEVYEKLNNDRATVNISYDFGSDNNQMNVRIEQEKDKSTALLPANGTPSSMFASLPTELRGSFQDVETKLKSYIENVQAIPVTFFQEFAKKMAIDFRPGENNSLISWMYSSFLTILASYFSENSWKTTPCEVKIELIATAKVVIFNQAKNVSMIYTFSSERLSITGFPDKALVKIPDVKTAPMKIQDTVVLDNICTESVFSKYLLKRERLSVLKESILDPYQKETADEVLDTILQKLILLDMADGLQDVVIDDIGIILFFDPVMNPDEMEVIIASLKQSYNKTRLLETPFMEGCNYWTVDIPIMEDTEKEILQAGRIPQSMGGDPSPIPMAHVAANAATPITDLVSVGKLMRSL